MDIWVATSGHLLPVTKNHGIVRGWQRRSLKKKVADGRKDIPGKCVVMLSSLFSQFILQPNIWDGLRIRTFCFGF